MKTLDLSNSSWFFKEFPVDARKIEDLEAGQWLPAVVPAPIYSSLINQDQICEKDLYQNPENYQWVSQKPWIFKTEFNIEEDSLNCSRLDLVLDRLDTYTQIWINGRLLSKTNSCFLEYRFDIKTLLTVGQNSLMIKFDPPADAAQKQMDKYKKLDNDIYPHPYRAYARKPQYSFGWDFCPDLQGCGILGSVKLDFIDQARLSNVRIRTVDCNSHYADVKVEIEINSAKDQNYQCQLSISGTAMQLEQLIDFNSGDAKNSVVFRIERPFLWWPKGYGIQYLYDFTAILKSGQQPIDQYQTKFGVRTIKINQEEDEYGQSFQFIVNDQPIKIKGANWTPISLLSNTDDKDYDELINLANTANFNMLRVWGGGTYEKKYFYDLCDKFGILIWQDFMFACSQYPQQPEFLDQYYDEAEQIIKTLGNHPSIALWCGNNECQILHKRGYLGRSKQYNGKKIFEDLLPKLVQKIDPDREYISTTPLGNSKDLNAPSSGTFHNWNIWGNNRPILDYITEPTPRFAAEFGFQSMPNLRSLERIVDTEKLKPASFDLEKLNYQNNGNARIAQYISEFFPSPDNIDDFVYLSQLTQARALKIYTEHLRINSRINAGCLFWQFNEPFPAISWSCIDYFKKPKAAYFYAKRFYSPILIGIDAQYEKSYASGFPEIENLRVVIVNDLSTSVTAEISCSLMDFKGQCMDKISYPASVLPNSTSAAKILPASFTNPENKFNTYLYTELIVEGRVLSRNTFFFAPDKYINWPEHVIESDVIENQSGSKTLNLKSKHLIKDLFIDTPYCLDDNFITLLPDNPYSVDILTDTSLDQVKNSLKFRSINSVLNNL